MGVEQVADKDAKTATPGFVMAVAAVPVAVFGQHVGTLMGESATQAPSFWGIVQDWQAAAWFRSQAQGQVELYQRAAKQATGEVAILTVAELPTRWATGRVFHKQVEWRWRATTADKVAVLGLAEDATWLTRGWQLLTGEATAPETNQAVAPLTAGWQVRCQMQHLVGSTISEPPLSLAAQSWSEVRLPYPLLYPIAHGGDRNRQPRLKTQVYATSSGCVRYIRFCDLQSVDITKNEGCYES